MSLRECFELMARKGFGVMNERKNARGETLLHCSAEEGNVELARVLLGLKADVNQRCQGGCTPLVLAARCGHVEIAALLLKNGADTHPGIFALHAAAEEGHPDVVRLLLENGANVREGDGVSGWTPARFCVAGEGRANERAESLSAIMRYGADVHEVWHGNTLLHTAAEYDSMPCLQVLVDNGLDVNVKADVEGHPHSVTPLDIACAFGQVEAVRELHRLGADLNAIDSNGRTPLFSTVMGSNFECLTVMMALGASFDARDKLGFTGLHWAAAAGDMKAAYLLVEGGGPIDALSNDGYSPLMVCMKPQLIDDLGEFMWAGSTGERKRVARLLMEMEADVDNNVMKYAVEGSMADALAEIGRSLRKQSSIAIGNLAAINNTLVKHSDDVVFVRLVNRNGVDESSEVYKLNTELVQYLAEQRDGRKTAALPQPMTDTSSVLSNLLDPGRRGFRELDEAAAASGKDGKEVKLTYDGADFTKDGFAVTVEYLTTGRVDAALVTKNRASGVGEGSGVACGASANGDRNADNGSESARRKGKRNRKSSGCRKAVNSTTGVGASEQMRKPLFDAELAGKALQAASYFCLEGMTKEVWRLMDVYGFAYDECTAIAGGDARGDEEKKRLDEEAVALLKSLGVWDSLP